MKHLDETQLGALLDGALEDRARADADRHLAECVTCREAFAELETQDQALARALDHDPGDAYFESFASRVQERIRAESMAVDRDELDQEVQGLAGSARRVPPVSLGERISRWLSGPRLAWAGAAAAVIVGAGLVFQIGNERPTRTLQSRDLIDRSQQVDQAPRATAPATELQTRTNATSDDRALQSTARDAAPAPVGTPSARRADAGAGAERAGVISSQEEVTSQLATPPQVQAPGPSAATTPPIAATAPPSAAKTTGAAVSGRSREVRRENGEDVSVRGQSLGDQAAKPASGFALAPDAGARAKRTKEAAKQIAGGPLDTRAKAREEAARPEAGTYALESAGGVQVCGTVRNAAGNPISGARVAFADLGASTTTDATGRWCLDAAPGEHSMTVMAVGFREVRRSFRVAEGAGNQDFTLAAVPVLEGSVASSAWPPAAQAFAAAAEYATREAEAKKTAGAFDNAATHWQRVTDVVKLGPVSVTARRYLADARYRAWQLEPSRARSMAAISALASYLAVVPAGAEREKTARRLDQVRR